jgi:ubiquinone/menaquinone biosynthesis C-methylase UbiE
MVPREPNSAPELRYNDNSATPALRGQYFDLIYCGSVFTHIDDLADAWLLELRRITRPGGRIYVTVHDKHRADLMINNPTCFIPNVRKQLLKHDKDGVMRRQIQHPARNTALSSII